MQIELSLFLGISLSGWILGAFLLEYLDNRKAITMPRMINLEKRKCLACASVYFISVLFEFWRCPLCGSINKEK